MEHIHCSPSEDRQFRFKLNRVTKPDYPAIRRVSVHGRNAYSLPTEDHRYHVYTIGGVPPVVLNLGTDGATCGCRREKWIHVPEDMKERSFIFQIYNDDGVMFPRENMYYMVTKQGYLIIAILFDSMIRTYFDVSTVKYLRLYSNYYFKRSVPNQIVVGGSIVNSINEVVRFKRKYDSYSETHGHVFYYVNGYYHKELKNNIPVDAYVECMYDSSINIIETYKIKDLHTFLSERDKRTKYLIHRDRTSDFIEYEDDLEIYITALNEQKTPEGLFYYRNREEAIRNVTDKDFSLDTKFVNNQGLLISNKWKRRFNECVIYIHNRHPNFKRPLLYSALKLHELYKLPVDVEHTVICNAGYGISEYRAEYLENSPYFKIASTPNLNLITKELAYDALGYNGTNFYFGYNPVKVESNHVRAPAIFTGHSYAYEYDEDGVMLGYHETLDAYHLVRDKRAKFVEFVQGRNKPYRLYAMSERPIISTRDDYRIIAARFEGDERRTDWADITDEPFVKIEEHILTIKTSLYSHYRIIYLNDPYMLDAELDISKSFPIVNLVMQDIKGGNELTRPLDIYFDSLEVFLNGKRLIDGIDYFKKLPRISICNKEYIDHTKDLQKVHVRGTGFALTEADVNARESKGFVNHGVVTRDRDYTIYDDKVFSTFIRGKLIDREELLFAEEDTTLRTTHDLNGSPYVLSERMNSLKRVTGQNTYPKFIENEKLNLKIKNLYNEIYPEPDVDQFNTIPDHYYVFSPLVSRVLRDMLRGILEPEIYTKNYQEIPIRKIIDERYSIYMELDPVLMPEFNELIEIHPDYGNTIIEVNVFQYRFLYNLIGVITNGNHDRINLSGYLSINRETDLVDEDSVAELLPPQCGTCNNK